MKKREYAFDLLRVIAMIMVVIIHVSNVYGRRFALISHQMFAVSLVTNTISRVSVPIFLMISGALLLERAFDKKKYFTRLKKFVILIAVWDIIYLVWEYLYLGRTHGELWRLLYEPYRAHLWFLYAILLLYAIQPVLRIILQKLNKPMKIVLLIVWFVLCTLCMFNHTLSAHFTVFTYIGFFVLGKYLYDFAKKHDIKKYTIPLVIVMIICFAASVYLNYKYSLKYDRFYNLYFGYRTPFIMIPSFITYVLVINYYTKDSISDIFMKLSDVSLGVYLIHGIFLDMTVKIFDYPSIHTIYGIPIFTVDILIASVLAVSLMKKSKILSKII